jgi:hypothetical protein
LKQGPLEVEAKERVAESRVTELLMVLKIGVVGDVLVGAQAHGVDRLVAQFQELDRPVRDHPDDHPVQARTALEIVRVGPQNGLLVGFQLHKPVGARADGFSIGGVGVEIAAFKNMAGDNADPPGFQSRGEGFFVNDTNGQWIERLHGPNQGEIRAEGGQDFGVRQFLVGENNIGGGEGRAVVPTHVRSKFENNFQTAPADGPGFGQVAHELEVPVVFDQAVEDIAVHGVGGGIGGQQGVQPGGVAEGRLDEGVAVRGRAVARQGGLGQGVA